MAPDPQKRTLLLPVDVVDRVDVGRLLRELEGLENSLRQTAAQGGDPANLPRTSRLLTEVIQANDLQIVDTAVRARLIQFLEVIHDQAPTLHMSFSADPSPLFTQRLVTYLRKEIHPFVLLQVGQQPNMGAGCVVRTTNKYFDFSLREHFKQKRGVLLQKIEGVVSPTEAQP